MENPADLPAQSSATTTNAPLKSIAIQNALRQLHKSSHKISKPNSKSSVGDIIGEDPDTKSPCPSQQQPLPQPPVYNINKNDFREVVQKLTGSPAHQNRSSSPRETSKSSARLQKIRPPPLAQLSNRSAPSDPLQIWPKSTPLSPLPPLPPVSGAAESPISAYMRCLRSGTLPVSPGPAGPVLPLGPPSPLGLGCLPSPRSAYQMMLSPGLFIPPSPGLPLPSPRWKDQ